MNIPKNKRPMPSVRPKPRQDHLQTDRRSTPARLRPKAGSFAVPAYPQRSHKAATTRSVKTPSNVQAQPPQAEICTGFILPADVINSCPHPCTSIPADQNQLCRDNNISCDLVDFRPGFAVNSAQLPLGARKCVPFSNSAIFHFLIFFAAYCKTRYDSHRHPCQR